MTIAQRPTTGELYALEQFIAKWLDLYRFGDLEGVIRLYFKHRAENFQVTLG